MQSYGSINAVITRQYQLTAGLVLTILKPNYGENYSPIPSYSNKILCNAKLMMELALNHPQYEISILA